ncbi:MAG: helix-turn-helix transcriptional regulator [Acidimicrobiales bacterium]
MPETRCQFPLAPPRHFLYPAVLLLLAEQPSHGYRLVEDLSGLGFARVDRPSVYRALADLERDGLVRTWDEPPAAGSTRHVHALTPDGEQALQAWMSVVAQERACLDLVLQRYWYCNAHLLAAQGASVDDGQYAVAGTGREEAGADHPATAHQPRRVRFQVAVDRSNLVVEARSNIGPIAFSTSGLTGWIDVELCDGLVGAESAPAAHLEARVSELTSGNPLYDAELLRRVDARRHPVVTMELTSMARMGEGNCYQLGGDVVMHGVSRQLVGAVTATVIEARRDTPGGAASSFDRRMIVAGEHVLDIRHFQMEPPTMPLLKLYPDVRLHLHLEADALE